MDTEFRRFVVRDSDPINDKFLLTLKAAFDELVSRRVRGHLVCLDVEVMTPLQDSPLVIRLLDHEESI